MKLTELQAHFARLVDDRGSYVHVDDIVQADGVWFLCPKCFLANGSSDVGTHGILCWAPKVPQTISPTGGRWELRGTGIADLSLVAGSPSVKLTGGCAAHFFVQRGEISSLT